MLSFSHYLCRCDAYTEEETDHSADHRGEAVVTLEDSFPHYGKRCRTRGVLREYDCFDKCYPISAPSRVRTLDEDCGGDGPVLDGAGDAAGDAAGDKRCPPPKPPPPPCDDVFWAITCSGK